MARNRFNSSAVLAGGALAAVALVAPTTSLAAPAAASVSAPGNSVSVSISKSHVVTMPKVLRPGVHRIRIHSQKEAELQIVRARKGYTDAELASDANAALIKGKIPALKRFERNTVFIAGVVSAPGKTATLVTTLARGNYIALDIRLAKTTASKMTHFTVTGKPLAGRAPKVPTVRAIHSVDFAANPASIPSSGMLGFANRSTDNHFIEVARMQGGKTFADLDAWIEATSQGQHAGPPPLDEKYAVESGVVSPGHTMSFAYDLPSGDYALLCWWPDAHMGGMPHAFMGMYRAITVE